MNDAILLVGASVRAAADSAKRGGMRVIAADLFCDSDLDSERCYQVGRYPLGFVQVSREVDPRDWMYTGALENHPLTISHLSTRHRLLGNDAAVVRRLRDPENLSRVLRADGLAYPKLGPIDSSKTRWLIKPRRSAGGHHIRFARQQPAASPDVESYVQQYQRGIPLSAVFVAAGGQAVLLGITRQLIGTRFAGADRFHYCGSLGPCRLSEQETDGLRRIGRCLARSFGLTGLFGVDLIRNTNLWTVEVNPRFTASIEVLERSGWLSSAVRLHVDACRDNQLPDEPAGRDSGLAGKAILHAPRALDVTEAQVDNLMTRAAAANGSSVRDIPVPGTHIRVGHPVATVLRRGDTAGQILHGLMAGAREVYEILQPGS